MLDILAAAGEHAEATAWGMGAGSFVALAMIVVFGIMLLLGAPRIIAGILDSRIEGIRKQLDEAKALRAEAEKLRDEYARKASEADKEAAALRAQAERQAEEIVEKAKLDADALFFSRDITVTGDMEAMLALRNALDDCNVDLRADLGASTGPFGPAVRSVAEFIRRQALKGETPSWN